MMGDTRCYYDLKRFLTSRNSRLQVRRNFRILNLGRIILVDNDRIILGFNWLGTSAEIAHHRTPGLTEKFAGTKVSFDWILGFIESMEARPPVRRAGIGCIPY